MPVSTHTQKYNIGGQNIYSQFLAYLRLRESFCNENWENIDNNIFMLHCYEYYDLLTKSCDFLSLSGNSFLYAEFMP